MAALKNLTLNSESDVTKAAAAEAIVRTYMGWSVGAGFIPFPWLDLAAISAVELKMLEELTKLYGVPFSREAARVVIGSLLGGGGTALIAPSAASLVKMIPGIGTVVGALTEPAMAGAATFALGRVFISHFESGGTLLNFKTDQAREQFNEEFGDAKTA